jgi:PEP-CTERM motif
MRISTFLTFAAGILAAALTPASADTIIEPFSIPIPAGTTAGGFSGFPIAGFNPSLGTLTSATVSLVDSLTWIAGSSRNGNTVTLTVTLVSPIQVSQRFVGDPDVPNRINLDLFGEVSVIGSETQKPFLELRDNSGGRVSRTLLEGTVTYFFTPSSSSIVDPPPGSGITGTLTIPEPSTWAMMLVGFAGLGYAGYRKANARRDLCSVG